MTGFVEAKHTFTTRSLCAAIALVTGLFALHVSPFFTYDGTRLVANGGVVAGDETPLEIGVATRGIDDFVDLTTAARRRHILEGEVLPGGKFSGGHRAGTGFPGKTEFPASWSDDAIIHWISDVATDPASSVRLGTGGDIFLTGTRRGIDIEVLLRNGDIWTGYPTNLPMNP